LTANRQQVVSLIWYFAFAIGRAAKTLHAAHLAIHKLQTPTAAKAIENFSQ
jgi:hypothetical protein